ncbi:hypothetical protein PIB30_112477 [Stylosanthes scabra]|uniref:Uncharacterized protein n=1 Tax=Stylosanthes scabra TaxID=79078 RepID=A0ABU6R1H2_9FABA|nr:hypothetical protein [Stylosanthes scabra]
MTATTAPFLTTRTRRSNRTAAAAAGGDRKKPNVSVVVAGRSGPVLLIWSGSSGSVSTESSTAAQGSEGGGYGTGDDEWKSFFSLPSRLSPSMVGAPPSISLYDVYGGVAKTKDGGFMGDGGDEVAAKNGNKSGCSGDGTFFLFPSHLSLRF